MIQVEVPLNVGDISTVHLDWKYLWLVVDDGVYVADVAYVPLSFASSGPRTWFVPWVDVADVHDHEPEAAQVRACMAMHQAA